MAKRNQSTAQSAEKSVKPPVRVGYTISWEADRKVKAAKLVTGRTENDLVDEALRTVYAGYFAAHRGPNGTAEPDPAGGNG